MLFWGNFLNSLKLTDVKLKGFKCCTLVFAPIFDYLLLPVKLNKMTLQAVFDKWGCFISSPYCWDAKSGTVTTHVHDLLLQQPHFTSGYLCIQFIRCLHYCFLHCPLRVHMLPAEQICFCLDLISRSVKPSRAAPSSNCRQVELHLPFKWRTGSATLEMAVEPDTKKRGGWVGGGWDSNTQISCKRIVSVGWVRRKKHVHLVSNVWLQREGQSKALRKYKEI